MRRVFFRARVDIWTVCRGLKTWNKVSGCPVIKGKGMDSCRSWNLGIVDPILQVASCVLRGAKIGFGALE